MHQHHGKNRNEACVKYEPLVAVSNTLSSVTSFQTPLSIPVQKLCKTSVALKSLGFLHILFLFSSCHETVFDHSHPGLDIPWLLNT